MPLDFKLVFVWVSAGTKQGIGDVVRAAEALLQHWPEEFAHSETHRAARLACLRALEGDGESEVAREAFVKAAEEAAILAPDDFRPSRRVARWRA